MKWLSYILIVLCFIRCSTRDTSGNQDSLATVSIQANEIRDSIERVQRLTKVNYRIDSLNDIIKKLTSKCIKEVDEFKGLTFYKHKTIGKYWPNRKTIYAECSSEGFYYLRSNYYDESWLFHTQVQIKIGDRIIDSEDTPSYDPRNKTDNEDGDVWENVVYKELGQAIVVAIAENHTQRVAVRFNGREYYHDEILSKADKLAIKEIYDLARAFGELKYYQTELSASSSSDLSR